MAVIPKGAGEATAREPRVRRIRPIRLPSPLAPSRTLLVVAMAIGGAEAPEAWLRALLLAGAGIVCYLAGTVDGRRDHAIDLLSARGVDRGARATTPGEPGA
jgi:hypothetical protein